MTERERDAEWERIVRGVLAGDLEACKRAVDLREKRRKASGG